MKDSFAQERRQEESPVEETIQSLSSNCTKLSSGSQQQCAAGARGKNPAPREW